MTLSALVTIILTITNIIFLFLMYKGVYVPNWKIPLFMIFVFASVYSFARYLMGERKVAKVARLYIFNLTMFVVYMLSAVVYHNWKMESIISRFSMMKLTMIILIIAIIYLNFVYIRAEISYKRKRGNIRIQQEKPKTLAERWKEWRARKDNNEIIIKLGNSTESEERTPPI
mgnify:CR=1 FL=1